MGVDRAACLVREPIFLYLSDGKFKCQCNGFFFFFKYIGHRSNSNTEVSFV